MKIDRILPACTLLLLVAMLTDCASVEPLPTATVHNTPTPAVILPAPTSTPVTFYSDEDRFEAPLDLPFGLAEGQTAVIASKRPDVSEGPDVSEAPDASEGLEISYVRFVEDNRCPAGQECEWPGEVVNEYEVVKKGRSLGTFVLGSHSAPSMIDEYLVSVWDDDGTALIVHRYEEEQPRVTSAEMLANCTVGQGSLSTYKNPEPPDQETHIVGIYQTGRYPGVANVYVDRAGVPLTLVLSAHEPTAWRIHLAEGVILEQIILNGIERQQAVGVDEVNILDRSGASADGYIVSSVYEWETERTKTLAAEVEAVTSRPIAAFYGCYEASEFTIP